ncbi:MAG TPA: class I SAM-dependent methyltransferase [Chitinophaga sp.]|uniref:class I SAM-dependent methyltransferase n=1 Tax=Chitinophaga sp. TaxID=1869181 RepID=UPI002CBD6878|nr:class I SAM-dependent methyltransferase [Chitinophaga sp.]HVI49200.1 class I SAM-dependent methyltransferase [Chitinophaga sp.]
MKGHNNRMKVPATSALMLFYTRPIYTTSLEQQYLDNIDFDEINELTTGMDAAYSLFDQMLLLRKQYIRRMLQEILADSSYQQLLSLGAGHDPLSFHVLENYPTVFENIYEVDIANMNNKSSFYKQYTTDDQLLHFLQCDITNAAKLWQTLTSNGYNHNLPVIIVFEGVIHFITDDEFLAVMQLFKSDNRRNIVLMDYTLSDESVPDTVLKGHQGCLRCVGNYVEGLFNTHTRDEMKELVEVVDGEIISLQSMQEIEYAVKEYNDFFTQPGEGIEEMLTFRI